MKYTLRINQLRSVEWQLTTSEAVVFSWLYELPSWADKLEYNGNTYYFGSRNEACKELPLVTDKPDTLYRLYKSLEKKGLISMITLMKRDYIALTPKGKQWYYDNENPRDGKKSEEIRNEIRNRSEKNPTNKYTNDNEDEMKNNKVDSSIEEPTKAEKVPYKEIVEKYNSLLGGKLPRVTVITDKRKKSMNTCVKQFGIESIDTVFNNVLNSPFLTGDNNKGWKCDFDFIFTASKYVKIMEGNYNGTKKEEDLSDESVRYKNFIQWVKQNAPRVMQMKASLDMAGYRSIKNACTYEQMTRRLKEMNDCENLLNKYQDPVITCIEWDEYGNK